MPENRDQFSSKIGFILAAAGSAVGLGNLAAFPVGAAKNGGAAFLILYLVFVVFICFPLMIAELSIGRKNQRSPVGAFDKITNGSPFWKNMGKLAVITPFMISVFYLVLTVWVFGYFIETLFGRLDILASEGAFQNFLTEPMLLVYIFLVLGIIYIILRGGVKKGIERAAKILMPILAIMLVLLVIFVLTLDNASSGLYFYLVPNFQKIDGAVISGALSQAFFSLSLGMGVLITYGSYLSQKSDLIDSAKLVAISDTTIAFFAGLLILPAIFSFNPNISPDELSTSSVGLIFNFLPSVFMSMSSSIGYIGASTVAFLFFLAVFFAAITSIISLLEVPVAHFVDERGKNREKSLLNVLILMTVLGFLALASFGIIPALGNLPGYGNTETKTFFDYIIDLFYETILPFIGFIIAIFTAYRWRVSNMAAEIENGNAQFRGSFLFRYVNISIGTIIPIFVFFVFLTTVLRIYFGYDIISVLF